MNEKVFSCHDGSVAAMIGKRNENKKWELYSLSNVLGMGIGEYNTKVLDLEFDDLKSLHSFSG